MNIEFKFSAEQSANKTGKLLRLATYASVATASLLIVAKLIAWLFTGSVSVLASLVDSAMDVAASLINLFAVNWSLLPPDAEHRFGHGKAQALAALGQSMFIAGSALFLGLQALDRLVHPHPVAEIGVGLIVIGLAMVATLILLAIQYYVIHRTNSPAIRADALHYATDLITNAATLFALVLANFGWSEFDPLFGLAIGGYILYSAAQIGLEAVQLLMDHEIPIEQRQHIVTTVRSVPHVHGVHDLRTRQSGQTLIIQLHLELDDQLPLLAAHEIADEVEKRLRTDYPDLDITIHQDPISLVGRETSATGSTPWLSE